MTAAVLPDSNVLFSRTLRDWLFMLSAEGTLYTVHSTEDILAEVISKYRDKFPHVSGEQVERIQRHFRDRVSLCVRRLPAQTLRDFRYRGSPCACRG